jgi:endonuclease YncB( thermonuclease family)
MISIRRHRPLFPGLVALPVAAALAASAATAVLPAAAATTRADIVGNARVVDSGTIEIAGRRIRLYGVDAPPPQQRCDSLDGRSWACGLRAAAYLHELAGGRRIGCVARGRGRDGATVAACFDGAADLARAMVRAGYAIALPYVTEDYVADESAARAQGLGLWSGRFETPAGWRRRHGASVEGGESGP